MNPTAKAFLSFERHLGKALLVLFALLCVPALAQSQSLLTCPTSPLNICSDQSGPVCFDFPVTGADSVTVTGAPGVSWSSGQICFEPTAAGLYSVVVTAYAGDQAENCTIPVNIGFGQPPTLVCPTEPYKVDLCSPGQVCLFMATQNTRNLQIAGASVTGDGNFCFQADSSGTYHFVAVASNACGVDSCLITVIVTVGAKPVIECPTEPFTVTVCEMQSICLPVPVTGADAIEVSGGGQWADGQVCFTPESAGPYTLHIVASNKCGKTACDVAVNVVETPHPQIACPTEPAQFTICPGTQVCAPLTILNADSVKVDGATWSDGQICFTPDTAGHYSIEVAASNSCFTATCTVNFNIFFVPAPTIACTDEVHQVSTCGGKEICFPLEITGASSVETSFGHWADGSLCFTPDSAGLYQIRVTATGACTHTECTFAVNVTKLPTPTIACPNELAPMTICGSRQLSLSLPVRNATTVTSSFGVWERDSVWFPVDSSGTYKFTIKAEGECGTDSCSFSLSITQKQIPTIACPNEPLTVTSCTPQVCVPFMARATDADSVVATGAKLTDDNICFTAPESGTYSIPLTAYGYCGVGVCTLQVKVTLVAEPTIACVDTVQHFTLCQPGPVCVPVAVLNADSVTVIGGTWNAENHSVCFEADKSGEFGATIIAHGQCLSDTCQIHAAVTITPTPVIACPEQPLVGSICRPGDVCVDLAIANATEVTVPGGTWSNDRLCFKADTSGIYAFVVTASNQCHSTSCSLTVHVEIMDVLHACFKPEYGGRPLSVTFSNCTTPIGSFQYKWSFGDGGQSEEFAPTHTYAGAGCYPVTLEALGFCGSDTLRSTITDTLCVQDSGLVVPTDQWINAYCAAPTLDGSALKPGDIIAAYAPGNILCGLDVVRADGAFGFMPIYRDDQYTELVEGAKPGDTISFRINGQVVYTEPPVTWTANGDRIQVCTFVAQLCQNLTIGEGWHLISWNVPLSGDINTIFGDQMDCIDVILSYDRGAVTFDPDMTKFSTLQNVDYSHGYWIKVKPACTITLKLCGSPISAGAIPIYRGWNLVSYWPTSPETPQTSLGSLGNLLTGVWGFENGALVYKPDMPDFSTLDSLRTHFGYWIKSNDAGSLVYPGFGPSPALASGRNAGQSETVTPSRTWMSIYGEAITLDGQTLAPGSRITAYTSDGILCGEGVYSSGLLKFTPIYGKDDADVATKTYAASGDEVHLQVNGRPVFPALKWQGEGTRVRLAALYSSSQADGGIPKSFALAQNYPNPFNPSTTIEYSLPTAARVTLEVFNVAGQRVAILIDGLSLEAGYHTTYWDGTDETGGQVASGIYFYRLRAGSYSETRKMMLLK